MHRQFRAAQDKSDLRPITMRDDDIPAIFLYSPYYLYGKPRDLQGFDTELIALPSERFTNAANWYRDTRRTFNPEPSPSPTESPAMSEQTPIDVVQ